ncbi:hypothetical protein ACIPMU_26495 [Streptomyces cyaneofuscatus]|uniref:hypothetical protein n=1 Tax=Streptomyces cyaneofuscatus TaxID=66883 RepID=UPI0037F58D73
MSDVRFWRRFWRRRWVRRTAAWTVTAAVLAGGVFWVSGGYDSWRADRALDAACDGDLAAGPVRELFGGISLTSSGGTSSGGRADRWNCSVRAADDDDTDAGLVLWARGTDGLTRLEDSDGFDAPLGHNWTGSFRFDPDDEDTDEARAVLLLSCGKGSGHGRMMTADADLGRGGFDDPATRERLVAVLTETATAYTRRTGCAAPVGGRVKNVGVSTTRRDYKPFAAATGSCAGLVDGETAARWGVRTVTEIPTTPAPTENCTLGGLRGARLYSFAAYYGPTARWVRHELSFEQDDDTGRTGQDAPNARYSMTTRCPGVGGTAVFQANALLDEDDPGSTALAVDHRELRTALRRFAERSAKNHGCAAPRLD